MMLKVNQMILKCFYGNTDTIKMLSWLNIVLILAPGCEFFCAKCVQFPLTFTKRN